MCPPLGRPILAPPRREGSSRWRDQLILTRFSYLPAGLLPHARLKIDPDAAHGFLFQHHAEFAADVHAFLT